MELEIFIWGQRVGGLVQTDLGIAFEYDPAFKKTGLQLSPVYLPLEGKQVYMNEPEWRATEGIPGLIYDSLPDRFGNQLLQAYFTEKGLTEKDMNVFAKLQYIGSRGMGALEYRPAREPKQAEGPISLEEIEKISLISTQGKEALQTNLEDKEALLQILHIGTSAGGARAKALIAIHKETGEIRSGQLYWGKDYDYCLLKIDGANKAELHEPTGYGRLEYTYYQMALDSGIHMMPSSLYANTHFMTHRFDRDTDGNKLHVHSLCGLLALDYNAIGEYSYEQYYMAARRLGLGQDSLEQIFRRLVFNVLAQNCDDHTKNFSFTMDKQGRWSLSPAYDVCYSYNSSNEWVNGHNMRVNGKRTDISFDDLMAVGQKFNIKKREAIFKQLQSVIDQFTAYAEKNRVRAALVKEVEANRPKL